MIDQDFLRRFIFEEFGIRGEWIQLSSSWQAARQHQQGAECSKQLLGQALAAVAMLSATIKFNGSMILQAQGSGQVKTLVAQATHDRKIRGLVRGQSEIVAGSLTELFGEGQLVITIERAAGEPYQGIVGLEGENLAGALENYFSQSEQLKTRLWLFANETHAAGLLLQELPAVTHSQEDWKRITLLADTLTEHELLTLDCEAILYRLFNQENVRVFAAEPFAFECACSRNRIERTLQAMGKIELEDILKERQHIEVICEFCGERYVFDNVDVGNMLNGQGIVADPQTRH